MPCYICGQIAGDPQSDLLADVLGGAYRRRILLESANFALIPSLGAISIGHVLVCPKRHVRRLADLDEDEWADYREFRSRLLDIVREEFKGDIHIFEHGCDATGNRIPCTVDHAHLHIVPMPSSISIRLPAAYSWTAVGPGPVDVGALVGPKEYLYYEEPDGLAWLAASAGKPFESQLLRRVLCTAAGQDTWNWREDPRLGFVSETERRFGVASARAVSVG